MSIFSYHLWVAFVSSMVASATASSMVVVRQESSGQGFIEALSEQSGDVLRRSNLSFPFKWPYVQMTNDVAKGTTFLTAYPDGFSYPALYVLDDNLEVRWRMERSDFTFWDLQFCPSQSTLYGILVTEDFNGGMYGRTLSNYTPSENYDAMAVHELFTLPYMWYVNASSIDVSTATYYALVNNFPGHENSTLDQKLVVADFSHEMKTPEPEDDEEGVAVIDMDTGDVMAQFIAHSKSQGKLFFAGPSKIAGETSVTVGVLCTDNGKIEEVLVKIDDVALAGPIVADDLSQELLFFVKMVIGDSDLEDGIWRLLSLSYEQGSEPVEVARYAGDIYKSFAAAGHTALYNKLKLTSSL